MTIVLFCEWIERVNDAMRVAARNILLLLDNASSHKVEEVILTNVRILMLPPNTTSELQPMDAGIIAAFKQHYKRYQLRHAVDQLDTLQENVSEDNAADVLSTSSRR